MNKDILLQAVTEAIADTDCFLVDVQIHPGNAIVVEIDNQVGVDILRCETIHRRIEESLDREVEDYELEVGSAGLTSPFKVIEQYRKNIGNEVEVLSSKGIKVRGTLATVEEQAFVVEVSRKVKSEESKRKIEITEPLSFNYQEVKYVRYLLDIK